MLSQRFYYLIKPLVPWTVRMFMRRLVAKRILKKCQDVWPINPAAAAPPTRWPGWPEGKKFAVVLTHDVEGPEGLAKCRQLAELEMELGFRSSFNFIPEGSYQVPPELRAWLTDNGFEVGVHDLQHNGKLYQSHRGFRRKAARINHYLKLWRTSGFRSGFMLRNLAWLHELDISYDSSTFDTDPFEPQPDGAGTIFPYWIPAPTPHLPSPISEDQSPNSQLPTPTTELPSAISAPRSPISQLPSPNSAPPTPSSDLRSPISEDQSPISHPPQRGGYVELPYTLPQDSTLFLVLEEKTPRIWLEKTDWLAQHGGMVLLNVHPDYLRFAGDAPSKHTFSVAHYRELLEYVKASHQGKYWQPLPGDMATWFGTNCRLPHRASNPPFVSAGTAVPGIADRARLAGQRAAVLLYSTYPSDPRPRRAAETMIAAGMSVDLLCLAEQDSDVREEAVAGVKVSRIRMTRRRGSKWDYFWQYGRFLWSSFWFISRGALRQRYDVVHVHNMPDFLVFASVVAKVRGAKVILDLHDPMPELMTSIYGLGRESWQVRGLQRLERWSIAFADLVLTPNTAFKTLFVSRGCPADKMQIVMNSPQPEIFHSDATSPVIPETTGDRPFRVMHHGLIAHRHGVDLLVEAFALIRPRIPQVQLDIFGGPTPFLKTVMATARRLGISEVVHYHGAKPQTEIATAILNCQVGVVPNRRSVFTEINFPTRLFEYLAMQRPVIAPLTQGIRDYFDDTQMIYFEPDDVTDLADRLMWVWEHPVEAQETVRQGLEVYRRHLWKHQQARFVTLLSTLSPVVES